MLKIMVMFKSRLHEYVWVSVSVMVNWCVCLGTYLGTCVGGCLCLYGCVWVRICVFVDLCMCVCGFRLSVSLSVCVYTCVWVSVRVRVCALGCG